jgi:hypothetical protein
MTPLAAVRDIEVLEKVTTTEQFARREHEFSQGPLEGWPVTRRGPVPLPVVLLEVAQLKGEARIRQLLAATEHRTL